MCPVCGKKVGAWHKNGIHPKCAPKLKVEAVTGGLGAGLTQQQRDDILHRINKR